MEVRGNTTFSTNSTTKVRSGTLILNSTAANLSTGATLIVDNASLADGRWQLNIPYLQYQSPINAIHSLFGDTSADGTVPGSEFLEFENAFKGPSFPFDFDNDGDVCGSDLLQFGNRFGVTL